MGRNLGDDDTRVVAWAPVEGTEAHILPSVLLIRGGPRGGIQ